MAERQQTFIAAMGSNILALQHIEQAKAMLDETFGSLCYSSTLLTEPIGMISAPFLNAIAVGSTNLGAEEIAEQLKKIETLCGNTPALRAQQAIVLDLDLLLHGNTVFHRQDWERPYMKTLMRELGIEREAYI